MFRGLITGVAPGSLAARVGLQPGDEIDSINGHPLRDVIDVRFYGAEEHLTLRFKRDGEEITVQADRGYDEPLGLEFAEPTFDGIRRCTSNCEFCFISQMPAPASQSVGLRSSLYVKDDDYRLSFLTGSFITLTNLDESDWARIGEQHLSPLYVSVHTTDSDLRRRMLRNPAAPDVVAQLQRLGDLGIEVHAQIVVIPGLNDGPHLARSISDLAELYPAVRSASVVAVGLTKFHKGTCRAHTDAEMRVVLDQVTGWQMRLRERLGVGFAYLSDEWYLRLGEEVPPAEAYDRLDLAENGVGLVRGFQISDLGLRSAASGLEATTLVTGELFAPVLRRAIADVPNVQIVPVVNRFFGETVTVAGLLTGRDVIEQLRGRKLGDVVMLPPAMFGGPDGQSLDEMWPQEVTEALGRKVVVGGVPAH